MTAKAVLSVPASREDLEDPAWTVAGTERTRKFVKVVETLYGSVSVRNFDESGGFRIRVEPANPMAATMIGQALRAPDWKQPGNADQDRFSNVAETEEKAGMLLEQALLAVGLVLHPLLAQGALVACIEKAFPTDPAKLRVAALLREQVDLDSLVAAVRG